MKVLVLLLTALLSIHVSAIPTPRTFQMQYLRRDENSTLLDLIAQYKKVKLQADQAEQIKHILLTEAQRKKLEIEKNIGLINDSMIPPSSLLPAAKTVYSLVAETYTVFTATGSAVVFANQGTTRTVPLNPSSTVALSSSESVVTSSLNVLTVSRTSTGFATPSYPSPSSNPVPLTSSLALLSPGVSTTSSLTPTTSMAQLNTVRAQSGSATGPASQESAAGVVSASTAAKTSITSGVPVTVLAATGSAIVLASQGLTSTISVNIASSPSQPPGSG